jgi:hypothetical protein
MKIICKKNTSKDLDLKIEAEAQADILDTISGKKYRGRRP